MTVIDKIKILGKLIQAGQTGSMIPLKKRVKTRNQSSWLACIYPMSEKTKRLPYCAVAKQIEFRSSNQLLFRFPPFASGI